MTKLTKLPTKQLEAKLLIAQGTEKTEIKALLEKRKIKKAGKSQDP